MKTEAHDFKWKQGAEYAIDTYGSELAGNVMNCAICGIGLLHHDKIIKSESAKP